MFIVRSFYEKKKKKLRKQLDIFQKKKQLDIFQKFGK